MKKLKFIIYSKWFSLLLRPFYKMLFYISSKILQIIYSKAKINSGKIKYFGISLNFPPNIGITFLTNIFWKGENGYEYEIGNYIQKNIQNFDYFFDIGANFGFYSAIAFKKKPDLKIFSFEPLENIYLNQIEFLKLNNVKSKFENIAISDFDGVATFYVPEKDIISEIHTATLNPDFFYNKQFKINKKEVPSLTLDSYVKDVKFDIGSQILVKIDVEGHEFSVFKGATIFLINYKPTVICEIEMNSEISDELYDFVSSLGYIFYLFQNNFLIRTKKVDFISLKGAPNFLLVHESEVKNDSLTISRI
jgi:FkbM family methyltransferase